MLFVAAPLFSAGLSNLLMRLTARPALVEHLPTLSQSGLQLLAGWCLMGICFWLFSREARALRLTSWQQRVQGLGYLSYTFFCIGVLGLGMGSGLNKGENTLFAGSLLISLLLFLLYLCARLLLWLKSPAEAVPVHPEVPR